MEILLLEQRPGAAPPLGDGLAALGHAVRLVSGLGDAGALLRACAFDLAILDHAGPATERLVRALREEGRALPILLLTASARPEDRAAALDAGADDCLSRPAALVEVAARVHALARRSGANGVTLRAGDIEMDLLRREVRRGGRPVRLRAREFELLEQLLRHGGAVVPRALLLRRLWGLAFDPGTTVIETQMSRLRARLNAGFEVDAIEAVRGAGYRIRTAPD